MSAGFGYAIGAKANMGARTGQFIAKVVLGGIMSRMKEGKFASGAMFAEFVAAVGEMISSTQVELEAPRGTDNLYGCPEVFRALCEYRCLNF
ncbi:hypothetical protein QT397_16445 [Microbulbifer sp. MKSA007]|nr:hypothetical protein QT397_16445 [Microbulbifer sp. MKSA007]